MAEKLKKPYKNFPLTPHVRGGWAKCYKNHCLYIAERNPKKALEEFYRRARQIDCGHQPGRTARRAAVMTIKYLANLYLQDRKEDIAAGKLGEACYRNYRESLRKMLRILGNDYLVSDMTPDTFALLGRRMSQGVKVAVLGKHCMARHIQAIRSVFKYAAANLWIPAAANFGTRFGKPNLPRKSGNPITTEELRLILAVAPAELKVFILLMANCAYTPRDLELLPVKAVQLQLDAAGIASGGVIMFPRPKMINRRPIDRAAVLWPETALALQQAITPDTVLVFHALRGGALRTDVVSRQFADLCTVAGIERRGPAWLRHWFRTVADETDSATPVARVMGHRLAGMAEVYVDRVEHHRITAVCDYVGIKLLGVRPIGPTPNPGLPPGTAA